MDADDASSAEMRRPFSDPDADPLALDEETVERLLSGKLPPAQAPPEYAGVAALLAATVAAPTQEELAGQAAALAELRAVTRARAAHGRRASEPRRRRRVGLAAVVVVGALAAGGVAGAATGRLPGPVREAARSILVTVGGAEPAAPASSPSPSPVTRPTGSGGPDPGGQAPSTTGRTGRGSATTGPGSAASPDLEGLCQAFLAGNGVEQGKKLDAAAFAALARAAGGQDKVPAYCQSLQPGDGKPEKQKQPGPPEEPGQGQGSGGPLAGTGGGNQVQGGPPDTPPPNS
jgi:hypothetical protein